MKICVYAIAKDEARHVRRFCESAAGADCIVIADTGSTDDTVEIARDCGATVHAIAISPWRFDHARNAALALVPADVDVCVSLDLDEALEPGWREAVEASWAEGTTRLRHRFDFGGGHIYEAMRVHSRHGYSWKFRCHEFQVPDVGLTEVLAQTDRVLMRHLKDPLKDRSQYMDMLSLAVAEDPQCARSAYYYARELYYEGKWADAIAAFERYLNLPGATWAAERCYARRAIGECYDMLGRRSEAESAYLMACAEASHTRDPWLTLAGHYHRHAMWPECYGAAMRLFGITERNYDYTALPACWSFEPHDLAALSAWHIGLTKAAIYHGHKAVSLAPDNARLADNLKWYLGERHVEAAE